MKAVDWLKEHRLFAGAVLLAVLSFTVGRCSAPAAKTVVEKVDDHKIGDAKGVTDVVDDKGSVKETITDYDEHAGGVFPPMMQELAGHLPQDFCRPILVPGEDHIIRRTVIERGPERVETKAATEQHVEEDHHLQLTVAPAASIPRFSVGWAPRVAPGIGLGVIDAGVRITSDLWISAWAEPLAPAVGVGIRVTF